MINVEIFRRNNEISGFMVTGHAGYKKHGEDIVCSAVSALTQTALIGLQKVAVVAFDYKIEDGFLQCKLSELHSDIEKIKSSAILDTMYEGLKDIQSNYKKYISLLDKEEV